MKRMKIELKVVAYTLSGDPGFGVMKKGELIAWFKTEEAALNFIDNDQRQRALLDERIVRRAEMDAKFGD